MQWRATFSDSGSVGPAPLRAIIVYKSVKAALQLSIALLLAIWWPLGLPEGTAYTGRTWGAWLVVGTTAALLPFEVYELVRVPHWPRALIFVLNLLIVGYLARRAWREHVRAL